MVQQKLVLPPITKNMKILAGLLFGLWFASVMIDPLRGIRDQFLLVSAPAILEGYIWTIFTYAFWHADFMHLLFNLWVLWIFGSEVETRYQGWKWWRFLFICALGGGVFVFLSQLIFQSAHPTLGFSGSVMGVVAAFSWLNWERRINFFFFSLKGKNILPLFIILDILLVVVGREPISLAAHFGGMLTGLLLVTGYWRPKPLWRRWKRYRHRRKFKLLKKDPEKDRKKYLN